MSEPKCETCPVPGDGSCLGQTVPRLCQLARSRADYRRELARLGGGGATGSAPRPPDLDELLGAVARCPERGPVLPAGLQPECGCAELTECRAGRGAHPGRVTLQDCLACVTARRG
jgi:hypothetical protein